MSDLDKLMQNLKKNKEAVEETPQETEEVKDEDQDEDFDDQDDDDDQDEEVEEMKPLPKKIEKVADPKPKNETPQETMGLDDNPIEHEVALLQNEGIFRRELLLALKELVDVQKVNAQVMIDIKKAVTGEKDAKK